MTVKKDETSSDIQILLEQYKLYVEMADRVSQRRLSINKFYISLISGILVGLSVLINITIINTTIATLLASTFGIGLSTLWYLHIRSYIQLNSAKFKVIHKLEDKLSFPGYKIEWEVLLKNKYKRLTDIEKWVPIISFFVFLFLLIWTLISRL